MLRTHAWLAFAGSLEKTHAEDVASVEVAFRVTHAGSVLAAAFLKRAHSVEQRSAHARSSRQIQPARATCRKKSERQTLRRR